MTSVTVIKNDHTGREVWRYAGLVRQRGPDWVQLEARFNRPDKRTEYHIFRQGDRFVEWFYANRWYSIFEMHDVDSDRLTGWYCNISRPAQITGERVAADDLALDLFVTPGGAVTVLDEEEFAALPLDEATRASARRALDDLRDMVDSRRPPFDAIPTPIP